VSADKLKHGAECDLHLYIVLVVRDLVFRNCHRRPTRHWWKASWTSSTV